MPTISKKISYEISEMQTKYKLENIIGTQIAHLTVLGFDHDVLKTNERGITRIQRFVKCKCDCGKETIVDLNRLMNGKVQSCGHIRQYSNLRHGLHNTRAYNTWCGMMSRCYNKGDHSYKNYGGKKPPIIVCDEWRRDFKTFYNWSINNGYYEQPKGTPRADILSIERIDNNGNYCPENCTWIPFKEQSRNRRNVVIITDYDGEKLTIPELAKKYSVNKHILRYRRGYDLTDDEIVYYAHNHDTLKIAHDIDNNKVEILTKDGFKVLIPTIDFMFRKNGIKKEV